MRDWIVGYEKGAQQKSPGVMETDWAQAESMLGSAPEELSDLYRQMNGATFSSGVHLFPVRAEGPHRGVLEESRISVAGLPDSGIWRFGEKSSKHLFALRKNEAVSLEGAPSHEWLENLGEEDWVYGVKDELTQVVKLYRSLEVLLATLIPPAESEEFGERTYARAMNLVQSALSGLGDEDEESEQAGDETEEVSADVDDELTPPMGREPLVAPKPKAAKKPAKAKAKKAPPARAGGKKAAAGKKAVKAAAKKPAAKKAVAKKPAAKKAKPAAKKAKPAAKAKKPAAKKKASAKKPAKKAKGRR